MDAVMFEDLDQTPGTNAGEPFFVVAEKSEDEIYTWLKRQLHQIKADSWTRMEKVRSQYLRYKGIQYLNQVYLPRDLPDVTKRYMPQMVVPLIRDAVDEKVARLLEFKPAIAVVPVHDEEKDKVDAKVAKRFLNHIDYVESMDQKFLKWVRNSKIAGESFLVTRWNPDKGPAHPMMNKMGEVQKNVNVGDVEAKVFSPFNYFYENVPSKDWEDVNYGFLVEYEYTDALKRDYPDKAGNIHAERVGVRYFDLEEMEEVFAAGMTAKVTFWHRKTKYLPNGFEAVFTNTAHLKSGPLPYTELDFPVERLVDGHNEGELPGSSFIEHVKGHASQVNNFTNMLIKQQMLCAHPKWFVQAGSIDEQLLNNDVTIVKVKAGASQPILAQANPISPQVVEMRTLLKAEFYEMAKSNSVVRGDPPPGVTAFVAMQYLSESENRRLNTEVMNLNYGVRRTYDKILKICGQFYKKEDQRTMWIIGKDSQWNSAKYDPASLSKPYNVMMQNTSALPESKSARTQFVLDMAQRFPNQFDQSQILEMTGLGQSEKFVDLGSAATRAAEDENEMILDGSSEPQPEEHEDHLSHWKSHTMAIQDTGFKMKTSPELQARMIDHIRATEMLMADQAKKNPSYGQILQGIPQWPMFFEPQSVGDQMNESVAKEIQKRQMALQGQAQEVNMAEMQAPPKEPRPS